MKRRDVLRLGAAVGAASLAGCSLKQNRESDRPDGTTIALEPVVSGVTFPTNMAFLPNGDRLITERSGQLFRHTDDGLVEEPVLDLSDQMATPNEEKGLVGMELHPNFAENRKLYLRYSGVLPETLSEDEYSHIAVLSEFEVTEDMTGIVSESERRILEVPEPGPVHNAGALAFGPEGYLYVALGDGRRTDLGESGWSWWYEQGQTAQNLTDNLLGGVLRIDVDNPSGDREYSIPEDNPLVGEEGRDEYYAWGLRNPYRMSFDGDMLFIGNVGETVRESIYITESGANHGWPVLEGSSCTPTTAIGHSIAENPLNVFNPKTWQALTNRISPVGVCPEEVEGGFTTPVAEYRRTGSRSVTGGYVYRGDAVPELQGRYICGDFIPPCPIYSMAVPEDPEGTQDLVQHDVAGTENGRLNTSILSFARDSNGEVYVLTTGYAEGTGEVRRITSAN